MSNKKILLLVTLLVLFVGVASASDVSDDTLAAGTAELVQDTPTSDNADSGVTTEIADNNRINKKANDNQMNYQENDDVAVKKDTTTIQDTTSKNMKTATLVNVNNYSQLISSVNDALNSNTDEYVINLKHGNYNATANMIWGDATGSTRKLIINGNNILLDGNKTHQFLKVNQGYTLELNNITLTNYTSDELGGAIENYGGNVTITYSNLTHNTAAYGGAIGNTLNSIITITGSNFNYNTANYGGAIHINPAASANITDSNFTHNTATWDGGAIFSTGTVNCTGSTFEDNTPANYIIEEENGQQKIKLNKTNNFITADNGNVIIYLDNDETPNYTGPLTNYNVTKGHKIRLTVNGTNTETFKDNTFILYSFNKAVTNYTQLTEAVNTAKESNEDEYYIYLLPGNYNATANMTWADATGNTRKLIINGNNLTLNGNANYQFMTVNNGYNLTLNNITLTNYNATNGGVLYNYGGNVIVNGATFINDSSTYKGGTIYNEAGSLTVNNTNFTNNRANTYDGGALYNYNGNLNVNNSNFTNNTGGYSGGAIYNYNGSVTVTQSIFIANNGNNDRGGAIASIMDGSSLNISDSIFADNHASKGGGSIYVNESLVIRNSNFTNNSATIGGAILNNISSNITITDSNLTHNNATIGGAIENYGILNITNSNLTHNNATIDGGSIDNYKGTLNITNSNLTHNTAKEGGVIYNYNGTLNITDSNLTHNTATWDGGAIYNTGTLNITDSNLTHNTATWD
ncbi:MAG: hypothetical protein Q4Q22_07465, partial [Methanosphaera sp.]|nr:hypothetical protein [Methanosphaera sp.]